MMRKPVWCIRTSRDTIHTPTPLLLILSPQSIVTGGQNLPITVYEPIVEIKDRHTRTVFIEVPEKIETGEAERIAVDWTAKGGEGNSNREWEILRSDVHA